MSEEKTGKLDLSAKRRALLQALLREQNAADLAAGKIPRRRNDEPAPLSFAQERLWFLDQYYPGSAIYNMPIVLPLYGPLSGVLVEATLNEIVRRHEILRTTFTPLDGRPVQVVAPKFELKLVQSDLLTIPEDQRQQAMSQLVDTESNRPFDLAKGPLFRAMMIRVSEQGYYLILNMHHIITDGWSLQVLMNEFGTIYQQLASGSAPSLPELPIQYADFAVWQRKHLQGDVLAAQLSYWKRQLEGIPAAGIELPADYSRPPVSTFRGGAVSFKLSQSLSDNLLALTQKAGITPFITLLAAFKTLLFRYTEEPSVIIGIPSTNRNRTELEGLIGFFVNTLVLRTEVSPELTFTQLLERVREVMMGAQAHQDIPFEKIVEELQPARNLNINPLFQIMFDFQNQAPASAGPNQTPESDHNAKDELEISPVGAGTAKFDMTLTMMRKDSHLGGDLFFSTDLFDPTTIVRLIGYFDTLLQAIVADPNKPIGELPLMPPAERQQVLVEWNDKKVSIPADVCVQQLIEERVAQHPDNVAAVFAGERLTYAELNCRANKLANHLRGQGVGPEVIVGICMDSSLEVLIAILGILKAGGAYLPIDPRYPRERVAFMLQDSAVQVILTQPHYEERLIGLGPKNILTLDSNVSTLREYGDENLLSITTPANACYVIYTSGSTGRPKGVVVEHRSFVSLVKALDLEDAVEPGRRVLQFASLSFDSSVREILGTFSAGATLYLEARENLLPGEPLIQAMKEHEITDVNFPPSVWAHLPDAELPALKVAIAGGEACPENIVKRWGHNRIFFNGYGPTETTFGTSFGRSFPDGGKPPIGRPIANVKYYVVDRNLQPCVIGKVGELLIGGAALARGYMARPGLTAERFIPDFLSDETGARLYRTGDMVRLLPDGNVDYIGRMDQQIKIRGYRIELGEIESVLGEHEGISASAVICHDDDSSIDKELIAYVVANRDDLSRDELRQFLAVKLPQYMVPHVFVFLDQMPLTPTGKVDLRQLPSPEEERRVRTYIAPRNPVEQVVAEVFAGVLGANQIGIHDNFFELGGHSLLVTQVVSRIRDIFQVELPIRRVFEAPSVAELAAAMVQEPTIGPKVENSAALLIELNKLGEEEVDQLLKKTGATETAAASPVEKKSPVEEKSASPAIQPQRDLSFSASLDRIQRRQSPAPAPLSFAQERLWFLDQFQPGSTAYNVYRPFPLNGPINLKVLQKCLTEIVRRHEVLRTTFQVLDGIPVQVVSPPSEVDLAVEDLRHLPDDQKQAKANQVIQETVMRPFDLATGPLMRPFVLIYSDYEHLLSLSIHHIISDAWSMRVFYHELMTLYQAFYLGLPSPLPELPIQYSDFAVWQRQRMQGEVLEKHLTFWKQLFDGAPAALELPLDHLRPPKDTYRGEMELFSFPAHISRSLERLSLEERSTMFMTVLAAFMTLLFRYTSQNKISIGAPIANRNRAEVEGLIGFFTNTLVLCTEFGDNPTFRQLLGRVREMTIGAYAHEDLPFERLVEELNPERNLHINPLFQVMLVLQKATGVFPTAAAQTQTDARLESAAATVAKFDLTLYMEETEQGLIGGLEYASELFERTTIQRLLKHFQTLLESIAANPEQKLSQLNLLLPEERNQLLNEWSAGTPVAPDGLGIHSVVEAQVERTPDAVAVVGSNGPLNYREFNEAANRIAHHLISLGVGPEVPVAICMSRGSDLMIALLAVLKAGGVYVPLNPSFPKERLGFMLANAAAKVIIAHESLIERLPENDVHTLLFDKRDEWTDWTATANPVTSVIADNAVAIIYTSGSTGIPKGVVMRHRTLTGLIEWQTDPERLPGTVRTIQYSSPAFDVSLQEIFSAWCSGGSLYCIGDEDREDFARVLRYLSENSIERIFLPYVALQQLSEIADANGYSQPVALRQVMCGGEQLKITPAITRFFARLNGCRLFNHCGPTETHVTVEHELEGKPESWPRLPPIGRPVAGAEYYILDRWGAPVPIGVVGELYIGGPGISRGYLNSPRMTAEKYVPNAFSKTPGARFYRSGDLVRYLQDGTIEFVGRVDHQLKIRGFRVEPGEIESCLAEHPAVTEAVVVPRELASGDKQLVAYVVPDSDAPPAIELREFLRQKLPDYMVPAHVLFLESLPLTSTGKLDRSRLPKPTIARDRRPESVVGPRSPLEQDITAIWQEVLGLQNLGVHDNFFDLGGHSLLATQIISRLRTQYGIEIPLRRLFEEPTIEGLARAIVRSQLEQTSDPALTSLLGDLEKLSEEEIEKLLSDESGAKT